ncbi:MAG TPA: hypothetical protein VFC84_08685 [Desulfosporosinus sp.]|nr:hypothetical protein [Desulfosporosinus sp.]
MIPISIIKMYMKAKLTDNDTCKNCKLEAEKRFEWISEPLALWHVGEEFLEDNLRVVFVGKPHRGEPWTPDEDSRYEGKNQLVKTNSSTYGIAENCATWLFHTGKGPYWRYTKEITAGLFGNEETAWDKIAMSNLIKCTVSNKEDKTTESMKQKCVNELGIIWKELQLIGAKNVIIYSGPSYDHVISDDLMRKFWDVERIDEKTDNKHRIPVGRKNCLWWDREIILKSGEMLRILRVSHPERMRKNDYVKNISDWLSNG